MENSSLSEEHLRLVNGSHGHNNAAVLGKYGSINPPNIPKIILLFANVNSI